MSIWKGWLREILPHYGNISGFFFWVFMLREVSGWPLEYKKWKKWVSLGGKERRMERNSLKSSAEICFQTKWLIHKQWAQLENDGWEHIGCLQNQYPASEQERRGKKNGLGFCFVFWLLCSISPWLKLSSISRRVWSTEASLTASMQLPASAAPTPELRPD